MGSAGLSPSLQTHRLPLSLMRCSRYSSVPRPPVLISASEVFASVAGEGNLFPRSLLRWLLLIASEPAPVSVASLERPHTVFLHHLTQVDTVHLTAQHYFTSEFMLYITFLWSVSLCENGSSICPTVCLHLVCLWKGDWIPQCPEHSGHSYILLEWKKRQGNNVQIYLEYFRSKLAEQI